MDTAGGIRDITITQGSSQMFSCNFVKGDNDITVQWIVDGIRFECSEEGVETDVYECSTGGAQSVLHLMNTASFGLGNYTVQCILQQNIPAEFLTDPSFDEMFENLTNTAILRVVEPDLCEEKIKLECIFNIIHLL